MKDLIERQAAIATAVSAAIYWHRLANPQYSIAYCIGEAMRQLPAVQPQPEEDCDTCKHGYFGDRQCDNCRVRYPSHYEREEEQNGSD